MLEGLVPISGKHSISRVVATLFIPQIFLKPENVFEKIQGLKEFRMYQKKTLIKPTTISIKEGSLGITSNQISGFVFEEYDETGKLKNVLKLENVNENQSMLTLENRIYTNWTDFKTKFIADIKSLSNKIEIYLNAVSLTYVDEFIWEKNDELIDVDSIFNADSSLLNMQFKKSKNGALILVTQGNNGNFDYEEKTEVSFNNDIKRIAMSHQFAVKLDSLKLFNELAERGHFDYFYDEAHKMNKKVLKDIFSVECQKLIGLK